MVITPETFAALPLGYEFTEPITVIGPRYWRGYEFAKLHLIYTGGPGKGPALTLGAIDASELDVCFIRNLRLGIVNGADEGLFVADAQHCIFQHVVVNGKCGVGIRFWCGHWNELRHPIVAGADIGIMAGIGDGSKNNCFDIYGGQVRNCKVGVRLSATKFGIHGTDCSNFSEHAVYLSGAQYGRVDLYTEVQSQYQTMPGSSIIKLTNGCRGINIEGMLNASRKIDYCVDIKDSNTIDCRGVVNAPRLMPIRAVNCVDVWDHERRVA